VLPELLRQLQAVLDALPVARGVVPFFLAVSANPSIVPQNPALKSQNLPLYTIQALVFVL
jgi:hypothetical protein